MYQINAERLLKDMEAQAKIGPTGDGGLHRPALSPADVEVRDWFRQRAKQDGFSVHQDGAGNLTTTLLSIAPDAKTLYFGSHLDSVAYGGRFDGPLGVLSALEVMRTINESAIELPFHLTTISFTDEEGTHVGLFGSGAFAGRITREELLNPRGGREALLTGMARIGITEASILNARRDPTDILGYLELHIEQGPRLLDAGMDIGVVTSLVGIRSFQIMFNGQASHAGTTPMDKRRDALVGAAAFVQSVQDITRSRFMPGVATVGQIAARPGAFNVIPGEVVVSLEIRHGSDDDLATMEKALLDRASEIASEHNLKLAVMPVGEIAPAHMNGDLMAAIETAADTLKLSHQRMMSFALHDPQSISRIAPAAMFFVPSVNGISHSPEEYTTPEDCVNGANVLLQTVLTLGGIQA